MDLPSQNASLVPFQATVASPGCWETEEAVCPAVDKRPRRSLGLQVPEPVTEAPGPVGAGGHHGEGGR